MKKNIMLPEELFTALYKCFVLDTEGKCNHCIGCETVRRMLEDKGESIYRRHLYTQSKTASSAEERETARQKYLDECGIHPDFHSAQTAFPADDQ